MSLPGGPEPEVSPESTLRHDVYINERFIAIFRDEDASEAFAQAVEESLGYNDSGGKEAKANGLAAWFRSVRKAGQ